jgi:hypothetical protein
MVTKRYRLLGRAEMNGAIREPGYVFELPDGVLGPHRTVIARHDGASLAAGVPQGVDEPMYEEIDTTLDDERAALAERHAAERADAEGTKQRDELAEKHAAESADMRAKIEASSRAARQAKERADLEARQAREQEGFKVRVAAAVPPPVYPAETDEEALKARQERELAELSERHKQEDAARAAAIEASPTPAKPAPEPAPWVEHSSPAVESAAPPRVQSSPRQPAPRRV